MGITRDSRHKRSATGAKRAQYRKKRKFELGRQPANTKIASKRIHTVRTRGGNTKFRALRLDHGNFAWGSESVARKTRIMNVVFHPSNNELIRTNTLTKSAVVEIDAAPFRLWFESHYEGAVLAKRGVASEGTVGAAKIDPVLETQFASGRLYAIITSRPGQCGRADGYILEGEELNHYKRQIQHHR